MKRLLQSVGVLVVLLAGQGLAFPQQPANRATVTGVVTDTAGARLPTVTLSFTGAGTQRTTVTNKDGSYSMNLATGIYSVTAVRSQFCELHRSDISLKDESNIQLDLEMNLCGIIDSVDNPEFPAEQETVGPPCHGLYCEEKLKELGPLRIQPMIVYHRREEKEKRIVYTGFQTGKIYAAPVFTFDAVTLRARTLIFSPREKRLEGIGDVKWQQGSICWRGQEISLFLDDGAISIVRQQLEKNNATSEFGGVVGSPDNGMKRLFAPTFYIAANVAFDGDPNELRVVGASNLPAGAWLNVAVYPYIREGGDAINEKSTAIVDKDGFFAVTVRPKKGTKFQHNLACEILFATITEPPQPPSVLEMVGSHGEYLGFPRNPQVGIMSGENYNLASLVHVP